MYGCGGLKGDSALTEGFRCGEIRMREISENAGLAASAGGLESEMKKSI